MFYKGLKKDSGIDITIKNNPGHILSPDSWDMVIDARFHRISLQEYKVYYLNLLIERWKTRKQEFIDLAKKGIKKDIKLKCFCSSSEKNCHALIAADFMNAVIKQLKKI